MPVASFVLVITGFASVSLFLLQRRMAMRTFNVFDAATTLCWAGPQIALAYFMPTIWSLVFGILIGSAVWAIGTYFLLPQLQHRLLFTRSYASQIFRFGKWIFLSSVFYFLSANFDRIYLASVIPLAALGIYGISRGISELLTLLVLRLGDLLVFPFVARNAHIPRVEFRAQFASVRLHFLLMAAVALSFVVSISDLAIHTVFDERYHDASWMLPLLALGAWISILSALNESTLLGLGKPFYATVGHALKCGWLLLGLPLANDHFGLFGAIIVISTSDLVRYLATIGGQIRERFSLWGQDIIVSIVFLLLVGILNFVRWHLGLGFSFRMVPSY
jgi:O-antigen/teichoic acid export membrane protein